MTIAHVPATISKEERIVYSVRSAIQDRKDGLLVISASPEDRLMLARMLTLQSCRQHWTASLAQTAEWLRWTVPRVVICDAELPDGHWQDLWNALRLAPEPPIFIVSAAQADERLWAEVLNMGGYDVLSKPYRESEVNRVLQHACRMARFPKRTLATRL